MAIVPRAGHAHLARPQDPNRRTLCIDFDETITPLGEDDVLLTYILFHIHKQPGVTADALKEHMLQVIHWHFDNKTTDQDSKYIEAKKQLYDAILTAWVEAFNTRAHIHSYAMALHRNLPLDVGGSPLAPWQDAWKQFLRDIAQPHPSTP